VIENDWRKKITIFLKEQGEEIEKQWREGNYPGFPTYVYHHFKDNIVVEARKNDFLIICVLDDKWNARGYKYMFLSDKSIAIGTYYQENYLNL
jgi:hypothetical protein